MAAKAQHQTVRITVLSQQLEVYHLLRLKSILIRITVLVLA